MDILRYYEYSKAIDVLKLKKLLDECGIGSERVTMYNLSAAQGQRFAEIANEMGEKIKGLGPNPARGNNQAPINHTLVMNLNFLQIYRLYHSPFGNCLNC